MDGLLAEINAKRKELETDVQAGPSKKYMRRAEVEAAKEEEDRRRRDKLRKEREEREAAKAAKARSDADSARNTSLARLAASPAPGSTGGTPEPSASTSVVEKETFNISPEECIRRLRSKGQPIRLFGETDKDRRLRLRALELLEERGGGRENEFRKTVADLERGRAEKEAAGVGAGSGSGNAAAGAKSGGGGKEEKKVEVGLIDMGLVKTDPNKLYPLIYYALKNVLKEWEEWMDARPEDIRRSSAGKLAAANQAQSAINLKPLFRQLRSRDMLPDVLRLLAEIVHHMQLRQYQKANDAYLRLSIGNAAWPIGVTSVGIHERNARERITEDSVAHVLNDEVSRKYIQAVKRLLTFSQTVRPPKDISQLMG